MKRKENFYLDKIIKTRIGDPINAIQLADNYLITGTMMGCINLYDFQNKKIILLKEYNSENISDISYNSKEKSFYIGIGDEEIKVYNTNNLSNESQSINVYESHSKHIENCENAFIFLSPESFFRIQLSHLDENTLEMDEINQEYELKYFNSINENNNKNSYYKGKLSMTNYSVPLDFDGNNFLWIDFLKKNKRKICVANISSFSENKDLYKFELKDNNEIGHISLAKLLTNNRVFIIHSFNKCEIRSLDENFTLLESFIHIGDEVYAFDIIYIKEYKNLLNSISMEKKANQIDYDNNLKLNINKSILEKENNNHTKNKRNEISINQDNKEYIETNDYLYSISNKKEKKQIDNINIYIITLDKNGNINLYKNKKEITLFNMYQLSTISQDYKDKHFFSMGYGYYIRTNLNYFCISSDHGCFIIKNYNNK